MIPLASTRGNNDDGFLQIDFDVRNGIRGRCIWRSLKGQLRRLLRLLENMRQFVRYEAPPGMIVRRVLARTKYYMAPGRKSPSPDFPGGIGRRRIDMDPHMAEVMSKARLEKGTYVFRQRLATSL
jgi:hypothetical protein